MGKTTGSWNTRGSCHGAPYRAGQRTGSRSTAPSPRHIRQPGARCMDCGVPFATTAVRSITSFPDWNDLVFRGAGRTRSRAALDQQFPGVHRPHLSGAVRSGLRARINEPPVTMKQIEKTVVRAGVRGRLDRARSRRSTAPASALRSWDRAPAGMAAGEQLARAGHDAPRTASARSASKICRCTLIELCQLLCRADGSRGIVDASSWLHAPVAGAAPSCGPIHDATRLPVRYCGGSGSIQPSLERPSTTVFSICLS